MTALERNRIAAIFGTLACEAGRKIMQARAAGVSASAKGDGSPVTQADLEADRCIREGLARAMPAMSVVSEEASETHRTQSFDRFILVDPLDGTREFVAGRDEFTVNIALIENGVPVIGVVYAPALQRLYVAGEGAWRADVSPGSAMPEIAAMYPIATKPIAPDGWRAVVSRSHLDAETQAWLDASPIASFCAEGSSMKFCVIAEGNADVYPRLSPTMQWDTAAGHAILLAAGGEVEESDGAPLRYGRHARGFANPSFFAWGRRERGGTNDPGDGKYSGKARDIR